MSLVRDLKLVCDGENCTPAIYDGTGYRTVKELREEAKFYDWVHRNGKDFCPDCK